MTSSYHGVPQRSFSNNMTAYNMTSSYHGVQQRSFSNNMTAYNMTSSYHGVPQRSNLLVNSMHSTSVIVIPNIAMMNQGSPITFTVQVIDTSNSPTIPTGAVFWNDGNIGGSFNSATCGISSGVCIVSYMPPAKLCKYNNNNCKLCWR